MLAAERGEEQEVVLRRVRDGVGKWIMLLLLIVVVVVYSRCVSYLVF